MHNFLIMKFICIAAFISCAFGFFSCKNNAYLFNKEPVIKVKILDNYQYLSIKLKGKWDLSADDKNIARFNDNEKIQISYTNHFFQVFTHSDTIYSTTDGLKLTTNSGGELMVKDVKYGVGWWWQGSEDRFYEGDFYIYKNELGYLNGVVELPLEDYLKGVVPYEIGPDAPMEALKAQAIAARSEAVVALTSKLYAGMGYNLTSDVECQVFSGNKKRNANTDKAIEETKGIILSENGVPMNAYYASNCGGHSELITNVWPSRKPFKSYKLAKSDNSMAKNLNLQGEEQVKDWINASPDVFCNPDNGTKLPLFSQENFRWQKKYELSSVANMISDDSLKGKLLKINPKKRGPSGRIYHAMFVFESDTMEVKGELNIRQKWKPALRSSCFYTEVNNDSLYIYGAGWGHGVGMCQSGAISQAKQGFQYPQILQHYYPKAKLMEIYKH